MRPYNRFGFITGAAVRALIAGVLCLCFFPGEAGSVGKEFIPLDHWAYDAVERFEALGFCDVPSDAPFTRDEFIALVTTISTNTYDSRLSVRSRYNLDRLVKEFTEFSSLRDSQARYDPPTFYVNDRPMIFEMDVDLGLSASDEAFNGIGVEYFASSSPEARVHFSEHSTFNIRYRLTMGPEHGNRARDKKPSRRERSFKGLTSLYETGYVILAWDKVHVFFGREHIDWGPSKRGNLITPGQDLSLDQLGWRLKLKRFRLSGFNAQLSPVSMRYLSGHRLEARFSRVTVGVSETVVYATKEWDPIYAFPLSAFYANQFAERDNDDNIYWSADVKASLLDALTVYGNLLVDDYQFERDGENPDKIAFDVGATVALVKPFETTWRARYRFTDIYTYGHKDSATVYVSGEGIREDGDVLLGGAPGPDAADWCIEGECYPLGNMVVSGSVFSERRGEGDDLRPYRSGDPIDPPFPLGVVQRSRGWAVSLRWELPRNSSVEGFYSRVKISNIGHVRDLDDSSDSFRIAVKLDF